MAYLKTIPGHTYLSNTFTYLHFGQQGGGACYFHIKEGERRDLGLDTRLVSNTFDKTLDKPMLWFQQMDELYDLYEKTMPCAPRKDQKPRHYYHFIISPDPKDNPSLETVKALANEWVDENLDGHQVAIIYHNDNENEVMHAHIIANAVNSETMHKLHISKDGEDYLADSLQEIARDLGLSHFDNSDRSYKRNSLGHVRNNQNIPSDTSIIDEMIKQRGGYSWREELRNVVRNTVPLCQDFYQLRSTLLPYGFNVERIKDGLLFITPEGHKISSSKLGIGFDEYSLSRFYKKISYLEVIQMQHENFSAECAYIIEAAGKSKPELVSEIQSKLNAIAFVEAEGIRSLDQFDKYQKQIKRLGKDAFKDFKKASEDYKFAKESYEAKVTYLNNLSLNEEYCSLEENQKELFYLKNKEALDAFDNAYEHLLDRDYINSDGSIYEIEKDLKAYQLRLSKAEEIFQGSAIRTDALVKSSYLIQCAFAEVQRLANLERKQRGLPPIAPRMVKNRKPPKTYSSKVIPYWTMNVAKNEYREMRSVARDARFTAAKALNQKISELPPYLTKTELMEASRSAQKQARITNSTVSNTVEEKTLQTQHSQQQTNEVK